LKVLGKGGYGKVITNHAHIYRKNGHMYST
jgi:hypothetical protein